MKESPASISQIYEKGKENLKKSGSRWTYPSDSKIGASARMNRKYLDSLFFEPRFFDPVQVDTTCKILGLTLKTPIFCSPISQTDFASDEGIYRVPPLYSCRM